MKIYIRHETVYRYTAPVDFGLHTLMIRPREGHDIHIESSCLKITPAHNINWVRDANGNSIAKVEFTQASSQLTFLNEVVVQHDTSDPLRFVLEKSAANYPFVYEPGSFPELAPFTLVVFPQDSFRVIEWSRLFYEPGQSVNTVELILNLNQYIFRNFAYARRDTPGVQSPGETLAKRSGSCRDFATLMLETCRCWGLAARFVSGYMLCEATEAGGASTHAWMEVYLPGAGWKGFDPTCGQMTDYHYVPTAVSRHPESASPISGSFTGPTNSAMGIEVNVQVKQLDVRVLLVNAGLGGPEGNCSVLLDRLAEELRRRGAETLILHLQNTPSSIVQESAERADALVFGTGTYWDSWSSLLQGFLEEASSTEGTALWLGKPTAVIVTKHSVGGKGVLSRLQGVLNTLGCVIPPMTGMVFSWANQQALSLGEHQLDGDLWRPEDLIIIAHNLMLAAENRVQDWKAWELDRQHFGKLWISDIVPD